MRPAFETRGGRAGAALLVVTLAGCGEKNERSPRVVEAEGAPASSAEAVPPAAKPAPLVGHWRMELASPGGPLPFELDLRHRPHGYEGDMVNGEESLPLSHIERDGNRVALHIAHYDSVLEGELTADGKRLTGLWRRRAPGSATQMKLSGQRGVSHRFAAEAQDPSTVAGEWTLNFKEDDGSAFVGHAVLRAEADEVRGTILTDTGDYRFLEGQVVDDELRLSVFDGAHAFLFRAKLGASRESMRGDFWSRDSYHASFTAARAADASASGLADPFEIVSLTSDDRRLRFDFPALDGGRLRNDDPRFDGKVVLIDVFGTWCPNCNDQAPLLAKWARDYGPRGLEVVGIAFEFTGEAERDMEMLARYRDKYDISYPLLLGGTSDKQAAGKQLPDLSKVAAYPTTIFVGRDGKVARIYSGYSGPATGERHERMLAEHTKALEALLAAPAPSG